MHVQRLIRRYFEEGLPSAAARRMRAHVRGCDPCRAEYDRLATLTRAAAASVPTRREAAVAWQRIEGALDARGGQPAWVRSAEGVRGLLPLLAAAAVLGALALGALRGVPDPGRPAKVQYRGGVGVPLIALEVYAVRADEGSFGPPRPLGDGAVLDLGRDLLQLRYRNQDPALRYLYVLGLDRRREPLDYYPRPAGSVSVAVEGGGVEPHGLGRSIRLAKRHQAGPLRVVAVFSARALSRALVHRAIAGAVRGGDGARLAATLDLRLPGAGRAVTVVRSFVVRSSGSTISR